MPLKKLDSIELYKVLPGAYELNYEDILDDLFYIYENGEKFTCPDSLARLSINFQWLRDVLPTSDLDLNQGNSFRKTVEVRSLYTLVCISAMFTDLSGEIKKFH